MEKIKRIDIGSTRIAIAGIDTNDTRTRRQREISAVKTALEAGLGIDGEIMHRPSGMPYISRHPELYISITHCLSVAAVAVDERRPIGIDAEQWRQKLHDIAPRFLSAEEMDHYISTPQRLLLAWTVKEAVYKAAATPGTNLSSGIRLPLSNGKNASVTAPDGSTRWFEIHEIVSGDRLKITLAAETSGQSLVP